MKVLATIKVFDAIVDDGLVLETRQRIGNAMPEILKSGKVTENGITVDGRGGFFCMEVDDASEIMELLGPELYDTCAITLHPYMDIVHLGEVFNEFGGK